MIVEDGGSIVAIHLLDLLDDAGIVVVVPLRESDAFLHLIEGIFEHLGEFGRHVLDSLLEVEYLVLLVLQLLVLLLLGEGDGLVVLLWIGRILLSSSSSSRSFLPRESSSSLYSFCICLYWWVMADLHGYVCTRW
jgi:hypothetical protein